MKDHVDVAVPMHELTQDMRVNITVTGQRGFTLRFWLMMRCLDLAALVAPWKTSVSVAKDEA